jgi:hypothetical protein
VGIVYRQATISPTKQELAEAWLARQPWSAERTVTGKVAEYRFDDPEGEVGVETILWSLDDGSVAQVPFTYRSAPLDGADEHLVGTTDHTVLGQRWVYDGCGDPVWAATLATAVLTGGTQAQMFIEEDGRRIDLPPRMRVQGSGDDADARPVAAVDAVRTEGDLTTTRVGALVLTLARLVGTPLTGDAVLTGRIGDDGEPLVLATLTHG